jgi:hypothetical protein
MLQELSLGDDSWALLSSILLWQNALSEDRVADADTMGAYVASRFAGDEYRGIIPFQQWETIVTHYIDQGWNAAVFQSWRDGWSFGQQLIEGNEPFGSRALMNTIIMGCLTEQLGEQDLQHLIRRPQVAQTPIQKAAASMLPVQMMVEPLYKAWQSESGLQLAEDIAADRISIQERIIEPIASMGTYVAAVGVFSEASDDPTMAQMVEVMQKKFRGLVCHEEHWQEGDRSIRTGLEWYHRHVWSRWTFAGLAQGDAGDLCSPLWVAI